MLFRNLYLLRFEGEFSYDTDGLTERLALRPLRSCGQAEARTSGWVSPFGRRSEVLVHGSQDCLLFAAGREEKLLPGSVVREALEEKLDELEVRDGFRPRGKRRRELKEDIEHSLLSRAFVRNQRTLAYIDRKSRWLLIDVSSSGRAEEVTGLLRDCLGSVGVKLPTDPIQLAARMTRWIGDGRITGKDDNAGFEFGEDVDLQDPKQSSSVVRCRGQELTADTIRAHVTSGKQVVSLGLVWRERISVTLTADGHLKRVKFLDVISEQLDDIDTEDERAELDAAFAISVLELRHLLEDLGKLMPNEQSSDRDA